MKIKFILYCLTAASMLYACGSDQSPKRAQPKQRSLDQQLLFVQRPVIRPVYVETEKNAVASHEGFVLHGALKNTTDSSYRELKLMVSYFSKVGVALDHEEIILKRTLKKQDTIQFDQKIKRYKNTSYQVKLISATLVK
jgi:hypothetical protein